MIDFEKIKNDMLALPAAISSGNARVILRVAATVQLDLADILDLFAPSNLMMTSAKTDPKLTASAAECLAACDQVEAAMSAKVTVMASAPPAAAAPGVGGLGDGTFLKLLLDNLPALLALLRQFFKF